MENPVRRPLDLSDPYGYQNPVLEKNLEALDRARDDLYSGGSSTYRTLPCRKTQFMAEHCNLERPITPDIMRGLPSSQLNPEAANAYSPGSYRKFRGMRIASELPHRQYAAHKLGIPVQIPQISNLTHDYKPQVPSYSHLQNASNLRYSRFQSSTPTKDGTNLYPVRTEAANLSPVASNTDLRHISEISNSSLKISPIDPRNTGEFLSSTPSNKPHQELKYAVNLENKLMSPKKSTMSTEELYAVLHKGKKKLNIQTNEECPDSPLVQSPIHCKSPETRVKSPESGYLGEKSRSRFSWSPSDGEYVDYNTNIDKLSPSPEAGTRQSWACSDRKGVQQTSRLDFKKLLLQHSVKSSLTPPGRKKMSAVEQLKLSKQNVQPIKPSQGEMSILELSSSPRNLQNRRTMSTPTSPKNGPDKQRSIPKLLSPRSQWRFNNPRSDVLSTTILEDCCEDEHSTGALQQKSISNAAKPQDFQANAKYGTNTNATVRKDDNSNNCSAPVISKSNQNLPASSVGANVATRSAVPISQYLRAQRAQFFGSSQTNSNASVAKAGSKDKTCVSPPTLETAF